MVRNRSLVVLVALFALACAVRHQQLSGTTVTTSAPRAGASYAAPGRLSQGVRPTAYTLEIDVLPELTRFSGRTQIAIELSQSSQRVQLHGAGLEVQEVLAVVDGQDIPGKYRQLTEDGLAELAFERPLPAGRAVLSIRYQADFERTLRGLYRVEQKQDAYAFTQFEPYAARKAFPCFDEPAFKTPFDVYLTVHAEHTGVSNGALVSEEAVEGGYKRLRFETTPPLPTYLVAMAVGPFDVVEGPTIPPSALRQQPIPFRGIATRGQGEKLSYALAQTPAMVEALEQYFDIAYPYSKLDIIAVPDFAAGAMENAGAITFRDYLLLFTSEAPESQRRAFAYVMAHELAHQWFGNLVTMQWWDDLWLNEAFATWMGHAIVDRLWPEQNAHLAMLSGAHHAMDEDSLLSARMIRQPIETTHDISGAFDAITYSKGGAVLGMFERFVGPEVFRRGVSRYLQAHALGNATSDDLLQALSTEAGRDLAPAFNSFLNQAGVPLIEVEGHCEAGKGSASLRQSRYLPAGSAGERDRTWQVPLCIAYGAGGVRRTHCDVLAAEHAVWTLPECPSWLIPNAEAGGYFNWALADPDLRALRQQGLPLLAVRERVSLAHALEAGFDSGHLGAAEVLAALPQLSSESERAVARAPMSILGFVHDHISDRKLRPLVEAYARGLYAPTLTRLGLSAKPGEDGDTALLRRDVLAFLSRVGGDRATRRRLAQLGKPHLRKAAPPQAGLSTDVLGVAMRIAMQEGDGALFDAAYERFKGEQDPMVRGRLLSSLAAVRDSRSMRALSLCLDPALRVNEVLAVLADQLSDEVTREAAYQFVVQHYESLSVRLSSRQLANIPGLTTGFCSADHAKRLQAFFGEKASNLEGGPRALSGALEELRLCQARVLAQRESVQAFFRR